MKQFKVTCHEISTGREVVFTVMARNMDEACESVDYNERGLAFDCAEEV